MTWVSKQEYRQSSIGIVGLTLNPAFLREIKEDNIAFRDMLEQNLLLVSRRPLPLIRDLSDRLALLRDALESYFALEEFYGYFRHAHDLDPVVTNKANMLRTQHEKLFLQLNDIVDRSEQILYRESAPSLTTEKIAKDFVAFYHDLIAHEQAEIALLIDLNNREIGGSG